MKSVLKVTSLRSDADSINATQEEASTVSLMRDIYRKQCKSYHL